MSDYYPPAAPSPQSKPRGKHSTGALLGVAFATLLVGSVCGGAIGFAAGNGDEGKTDQSANVTAESTATIPGTSGAGGAPKTTKPPAAGITEEGVLLVPAEVKPGTYRATVPQDSFGCYWSRLKTPDDDVNGILANGLGQPGEKMTVTIKSTDKAFKTTGCGNWVKIG